MQQEHRECIEQCYECAAACDICASSCLREDNVEMMKHCIELDMQCAAICRWRRNLWHWKASTHKNYAACARISAKPAPKSVQGTITTIARIARGHAANAQTPALKWPRNFSSAISSTG